MAAEPLPPEVDEALGSLIDDSRLRRQLRFVVEIDRLKAIQRRNLLVDGSRRENSAEHSWHQAMMAMLLVEHADATVDRERVMRMLLIHDVVEIDAGDTFIYDEVGHLDKHEREKAAADRLFGLLPDDQQADLRALWEEFEERRTPEARFAAALDRLQPLMHNLLTAGSRWRHHGVTADRVREINRDVGRGSANLGEVTARLIDTAVDRGYLPPAPKERDARSEGPTPAGPSPGDDDPA